MPGWFKCNCSFLLFDSVSLSLSPQAKIIMEELTCGDQGYWIRVFPDMNLTHRSFEQHL